MSISLPKNRETYFLILLGITFISFILSYAISNIAIFLFILYFFIDNKKSIKEKLHQIKNNKIVLLYVLFFVAQLIGVFYSQNIDIAKRKVLIMLPIFFLPAIISVEKLSKNNWNKLLNFLKYAILSIFVYYLFIHLVIEKRTLNTFVHFTLNERLHISQFYLVFILLIPILESLRQINSRNNLLINIILLLVSIMMLVLLGNKTALLFLILITIGLLIKKGIKERKKVILIVGLSLIIGSIAYQLPIVKNRISVLLKTTSFDMKKIITKNRFTITKNTLEHRILIDYLSLKEIKKALPFGVGTGDFQEKLDKQYKLVKFRFGMQGDVNNHNQYLEEFLKTGILGGFLFLILVFMLLKQGFHIRGFGLVFALFFAIASMVESYLNRQHGVVVFSFMIPFFLKKRH